MEEKKERIRRGEEMGKEEAGEFIKFFGFCKVVSIS